MRKTNYIIKFLVVITISLFFSRLLFGQKTLDHKLFLEKIKHSSDNFYKECLNEYDTYLEKYPDDVSVLIEKCKFIQNAQYDENEEINPHQDEFDSCAASIIKRFPGNPEILLFQTTYLWGDEKKKVFEKAAQSIEENPEIWNKTNLAAIYESMAMYFYYEDDYKRAVFYMDTAISNDRQYEYSLDYARILLALKKTSKALSVLNAIPDTTKEVWMLVQKANLLLELKDYSNALNIFKKVEKLDSTYINNADFASTLEGHGQYKLARKYLVKDTSNSYSKKGSLLKLLNHDRKYQDGSKSIATYNAFRDLGYSSDPICLHRLKLFFSHPTQPWKFRDLSGIISLLALLAILIIIPYVWILPVYFSGSRLKLLSPKIVYQSDWTLKGFWFVSIGYLFASFFVYLIEPEELYSMFNDSYFSGVSNENLAFQSLIFIFIMALFGFMSLYKVSSKILFSSEWSKGRIILLGVGIFILFRIFEGIYIFIASKVFDIPIEDMASFSRILLASKEEIEAIISTFGKTISILIIGLLVPVYEEIIFRGVILDSSQRHLNFNAANIFQSLLFATVHGSLILFPVFFIFGMVTGFARKQSGGLLPGIIIHILNNVIAIIGYFN